MWLKWKKTVAKEKKAFNSKWKTDYFTIETTAHTMMDLTYNQVVKTVKGDNAKQHFRRHTSGACSKLKGELRKVCVESLKKVPQQTFCLCTFIKCLEAS